MKNKGYTLIELLGVMIILALLIGVAIPTIINFIKNSNEEKDKHIISLIENAAELYIEEYPNKFPKKNGYNYVIEIQDLLDSGNLPKSVKLSNIDNLSENYVVAKYSNNKFTYKIKDKNDFYNITGTNNLIMNSNDYGILDYKIYGNSVQNGTPTLDTPVEIESVGERTNNLLSYPYADTTKTSYGITYTDNGDGSITVNGTPTDAYTSLFNLTRINPFKDGVTYVCSPNKDVNAKVVINYIDEKGVEQTKSSVTWSDEYTFNRIVVLVFKIEEHSNLVIRPRVEIGTEPTDYEPYGYKIPVKVSGKNLFDLGKVGEYETTLTDLLIEGNTLKGRVGDEYASSRAYKLTNYPSGEYSFRLDKESNQSVRFLIRCFDENGNQLDNSKTSISKFTYNTFYKGWFSDAYSVSTTIPSNVAYWQVGFVFIGDSSKLGTYRTATNIQIEKGLTVTDYEPYIEPVTTNIYLDEPLRKIGDAVDYIDFKEQKVVRNIGKIDLAGTWKYQDAQNRWYTSEFKDLYKTWDSTTTKLNGLSNIYPVLSYSEMNDGETIGLSVYGKNGNTFIRNGSSTQLQTGILYFELRNPIEEEIELPNLLSVEGGTTITIDTKIEPSNVEITYYKD